MQNIVKSFFIAKSKKILIAVTCEPKRLYTTKMSNFQNVDNRLETFRKITDKVAEERSYNSKAKIFENFFNNGMDKKGFKGDLLLWIQMLIPGASQRVYYLQNKQMVKLFSRIFLCDQQQMQQALEQDGDISETLRKFFENSKKLKPQNDSTLYLQDIEEFLRKLEQNTKEEEQTELLQELCKQSTALDLRTVVRLIKQDLRINAGARHILDAFGPMAYPAYQSSRDLVAVVQEFGIKGKQSKTEKDMKEKVNKKVGGIQVMTPISPMLASACKSVDEALKKNPSGVYCEVKYDGERVQIHKNGKDFKFFSRNLKPVMDHKVQRFHQIIPKAFPEADNIILDSEIIMVDKVTEALLPFGSLGAHKKNEYSNAEVCLFVFDCLLLNDENLTQLPLKERRKILESHINPIKSYVQLSESRFLKTKNELSLMTAKVLKANLEGVVLKSPTGTYQPGKRHWLKVKKDYLFGGKMADSADLVVLGAWFGSGKKGGLLSIFLMGCYDRRSHTWKTVTKVHSGLDDATNDEVHEKLMKLMSRADPNDVPSWLLCKKALVPDYLAKNPNDMPVWEITGAEFTKSEAHTAAGISIRFPRITKIRDDKTAEHANDMEYLKKLFDASKKDINIDLLVADCDDEELEEADIRLDSKVNSNLTPKKIVRKRENDDDDDDDEKLEEKDETSASKKRKLDKQKSSQKSPKEKLFTPTKDNLKKETSQKQLNMNDFLKAANTKKSEKNKNDQIEDKIKSSESPLSKPKANLVEKISNEIFASSSNIFKDTEAYFPEKLELQKWKELYEKNGGKTVKDPKKANLIFHETYRTKDELNVYRSKYKNVCRHLHVKWIDESLAAKEMQDFPLYAVELLNNK